MSFDSDSLGLRTTGLQLLRDLVHERTGLFYDDARVDGLADRLAPLVAGQRLQSYLDYYYYLKYDETSATEWTHVMDALSIPETYFWREIDQVRAAVDVVIPELLRVGGNRPLRIWSVPCASGEEPLSIAMMLDERGWFDRAHIEIHAADASATAIARAKRGEYRERAFRALPAPLKERYFEPCCERWRVRPDLHRRVTTWHTFNLMEPSALQLVGTAPLVFCRNLFIYFSPAAVKQVVDSFADTMPEPAYLCVAAAESLLRISNRFELEEVSGAFMYVKRARTPKDSPYEHRSRRDR